MGEKTVSTDLLLKLEKLVTKVEQDFCSSARNLDERERKRMILIDDFTAAVEYLDLLPQNRETKGIKKRVESLLQKLGYWDPSRFMTGTLQTAIEGTLADLRRLKTKKSISRIHPGKGLWSTFKRGVGVLKKRLLGDKETDEKILQAPPELDEDPEAPKLQE